MSLNKKKIIRPARLNPGDTIGIVAPAGPLDRAVFDQGVAVIQAMGFRVKIDERIFSRRGYLAGTDSDRAAQFNAMALDNEVRALICARGGYGCLRMIEHLDYMAIADSPKPIVGFSDITALHRALLLKTGLVTFHGPMVVTLPKNDDLSRRHWFTSLTTATTPPLNLSGCRILHPGVAEGVISGGNLATLCHLTGTWVGQDFKGALLLLEDIGEAPYRIDRMLIQMKMAGLLDGVAGILLGSFEECGPKEEIDALIEDIFAGWEIPIVAGVPIGHGRFNWTVPLGIRARLDTSERTLVFVEQALKE